MPRRRGPGRPFENGNPGKLPGTRHKATIAAEALLDGDAEALTRKAIEAGLSGDPVARRLCLNRILPPRRQRPVRFELPLLNAASDAAGVMSAITAAVAAGDLTPGEAAEMAKLVELFVRALEAGDFE